MTPIYDAMKRYLRDDPAAFHTPGHKKTNGAHEFLREMLTDSGLKMEVSLMEELDDLLSPSTCIFDAEKLTAELFGADECFFFVNGTTSAIQTMLLSSLKPGDEVIIPRNAHRSIVGGLVLTGARPIFINPNVYNMLAMEITPEKIERSINQKTRAVLIVSPTYYGKTSDIESISEICHDRKIPLLVDEAHGAHFYFSDRFPKSAIQAGANFSAVSTHKTLGSLTQTSILLFKNTGGIDFSREHVQHSMNLIQSTSPNQILLASLDIARYQMEIDGTRLWNRSIDVSCHLRAELEKIAGLRVNSFDDPTRISVDARELGLSGIELEKILRYDFKIQCELSDPYRVLFLLSYADGIPQIDLLIDAMKTISKQRKFSKPIEVKLPNIDMPEQILTPRQAFFSKSRSVKIQDAINEISAEEINFYPPGIPLIYPGEKFNKSLLEYIEEIKRFSLRLVASDPSFETVKIIGG